VNVKIETLKLYEDVFRMHKVSRDEFRRAFSFTRIVRISPAPCSIVCWPGATGPGQKIICIHPLRPFLWSLSPGRVGRLPRTYGQAGWENSHGPYSKTGRDGSPGVTRENGPEEGFRQPEKIARSFSGKVFVVAPGAHPFLNRGSAKPLKAGDVPFKTDDKTRADSVARSKQ